MTSKYLDVLITLTVVASCRAFAKCFICTLSSSIGMHGYWEALYNCQMFGTAWRQSNSNGIYEKIV